jgi:hypothetical protein
VEGAGLESRKQFAIAFPLLEKSKRDIIRSLHNAFPDENDVGIFITNSYGLGPQGGLAGLFERLSRINHSCKPNSERCWDADREIETLYLGDVAEMTRSERQCFISSSWRFDCNCECCFLVHQEREASDARRTFIGNVESICHDIPGHKIFDDVKKALVFLNEEGLRGSPQVCILSYAYEISLSMRNIEEARGYARQCYNEVLLATGSISSWTKKWLQTVEKPTEHIMWNPLRNTVNFSLSVY